MDLRRLHHVLLLAEQLNFSRAAERANLSQTAFSRSIQALETELGVKLFDRDTRSVKPTVLGKRLIARGRKLLTEAGDISRELSLINLVESGELAFGVTLLGLDASLRNVIIEVNRRHPKLRLNIEVANSIRLQELLEEERIEFFVGYPGGLANHAKFDVSPLEPLRASVFCRPAHPLLTGEKPITASRLVFYPWTGVYSEEFLHHIRTICGLDAMAPLPITLNCSNLNLLREVAINTDTLLWTWYGWLDTDLEAGCLVDLGRLLAPVPPFATLPVRRGLVQLAGRTCSPAAQMLMNMIVPGSPAWQSAELRPDS